MTKSLLIYRIQFCALFLITLLISIIGFSSLSCHSNSGKQESTERSQAEPEGISEISKDPSSNAKPSQQTCIGKYQIPSKIPEEHGRLLANAINAFSFDLIEHIEQNGSNFIISPLGVHQSLALFALASEGATAHEIWQALAFTEGNANNYRSFLKESALPAYRSFLGSLTPTECEKVVEPVGEESAGNHLNDGGKNDGLFNGANLNLKDPLLSQLEMPWNGPIPSRLSNNSLLISANDSIILDSFKGEISNYFSNTIQFLSGKKHLSPEFMNSWISEQTGEKLPSVIKQKEISFETGFVLINVIHLIDKWKMPFRSDLTKPKVFNLENGVLAKGPFMFSSSSKYVPFYKTNEYISLTLPMESDQVEYLLIMPVGDTKLKDLRSQITADWLDNLDGKLQQNHVFLSLPKLKMNTNLDLVKPLRKMGIRSAFSEDLARFPYMVRGDQCYLAKAYQDSKFKQDEEGVEAIAVTRSYGEIRGGDEFQAEIVNVNQPFIFLLRHIPTGVILFIGQVTDPVEIDNANWKYTTEQDMVPDEFEERYNLCIDRFGAFGISKAYLPPQLELKDIVSSSEEAPQWLNDYFVEQRNNIACCFSAMYPNPSKTKIDLSFQVSNTSCKVRSRSRLNDRFLQCLEDACSSAVTVSSVRDSFHFKISVRKPRRFSHKYYHDQMTCEPASDCDVLQRIINRHFNQIAHCVHRFHTNWRKDNSRRIPLGTVFPIKSTIFIKPDGTVGDINNTVVTMSLTKDASFEMDLSKSSSCVDRVLRRIRFPNSDTMTDRTVHMNWELTWDEVE